MSLDKIQLIGYLAIIVIVVSLAVIGMRLTGYSVVTSTGVVNVTISTSAAINFTTSFVNFGTGVANAGQIATVNTEGNLTLGTGWSPTANLTLENIGNVNVSLALSSSKNASAFIGGTSPHFQIKVINDTETASCVGNAASAYTEITTSNLTVCTTFPYEDSKDSIKVAIQLAIPSDATNGTQTATITATGTYT